MVKLMDLVLVLEKFESLGQRKVKIGVFDLKMKEKIGKKELLI